MITILSVNQMRSDFMNSVSVSTSHHPWNVYHDQTFLIYSTTHNPCSPNRNTDLIFLSSEIISIEALISLVTFFCSLLVSWSNVFNFLLLSPFLLAPGGFSFLSNVSNNNSNCWTISSNCLIFKSLSISLGSSCSVPTIQFHHSIKSLENTSKGI